MVDLTKVNTKNINYIVRGNNKTVDGIGVEYCEENWEGEERRGERKQEISYLLILRWWEVHDSTQIANDRKLGSLESNRDGPEGVYHGTEREVGRGGADHVVYESKKALEVVPAIEQANARRAREHGVKASLGFSLKM
uniref:Uncharacterized protein n=1 Tax=Cacopsylla melanoneura TaxID=428564 RepID=A0A8D8ZGV3_9HEMI